ncbi:hypothetical protein DFH11DRAFT_1137345 [Phellopilus nigrolimitatus]|nr:hypothetical protein DFH11DRAFT_1137345 [Phellopilus nigrolimitatus]
MSSSVASTSKATRRDSTPEKIAIYTVASSLSGALFTAAYESTLGRARVLREREAAAAPSTPDLRLNGVKPYRHPTALLSASAALNSGAVGFCFFSLREYVVSPALASRSREEDGHDGRNEVERGTPLTWSAMRMQHIPDTALTSALLGGAFNAWKRGLSGVPSGALTAALACTALQFLVNEASVQRIRFVSAFQPQLAPPASSLPASPVSNALHDSAPASANPTIPPSTAGEWTSTEGAGTAPSGTKVEETSAPSFGQRVLGLLGLTKLSDEDYVRHLKAKRDKHLARINELEESEAGKRATEAEEATDGEQHRGS